jgi:ribonuclease-3
METSSQMSADFQSPLYFEIHSGIQLRDRSLLQQAFTHRSYLNEIEDERVRDNERLEFLGDAVLSFIVSQYLFDLFPDYTEGDLTRLRSMLVRRETLARVAEQYMLGESLLLGRGEEESGGRNRAATLCAVFEAVVGAIFQDQGIDATSEFVFKVLEDEIKATTANDVVKDPKSRLQEYVQSTFGVTPRYKTFSSVGPDHAKLFVIAVTIAKRPVGLGQGYSKQEAAQGAAAMALHRLDCAAPEYIPDRLLEERYPLAPMEEIRALAVD